MVCKNARLFAVLFLVSVIGFGPVSSLSADWPTYQGNGGRTGATSQTLPARLALKWSRGPRPDHAPKPAWSGRDTRMEFDLANHVAIGDNSIYFGSSADCKVYALDLATGEERWTFFADGPVRFAPALWKDRVFVTSDDGYLYCLAADSGALVWKRRGGPEESMVLGNDRMISRWPARGGPVVADDTVYFAAGIWPSEGISVYALDAESGEIRWVNDSSGDLEMEQPHGGNRARSGVSAQGYLAVDRQRLFVPTGRGVPAVFDRSNGKLLYFHLAANASSGGSDVVVDEERFYNGGRVYSSDGGSLCQKLRRRRPSLLGPALPPIPMVAVSGGIFRWENGRIAFRQWIDAEVTDRKGNTTATKELERVWLAPSLYGGASLILAGGKLVSGGEGPGGFGVTVVDVDSKTPLWSSRTDGKPIGLSVSNGRLVVSTASGTIACYGPGEKNAKPAVEISLDESPYGDNTVYEKAAGDILEKTGRYEGYCLDLACRDGALAFALARRTKLHILAVSGDPRKVAAARRKLDAAGLYGVRVTVLRADESKTPLPDYFADLVVSGRSVTEGAGAAPAGEMHRLTRPYGGMVCVGRSGAMQTTVRGSLEGAGQWTHQYADAAATLCSDDRLAKGPLGVLWFTDLDYRMPSRHGRGPAPLFQDGFLVIEGLHGLLCVNAYNGRRLWEFPLKNILKPYDQEHLVGTAATNSNMCLNDGYVYLRTGDRCLRIELATGKRVQEYTIPPGDDREKGVWGYIACEENTLFGTRANRGHVVRQLFRNVSEMKDILSESVELFALDVQTGNCKWRFPARHSIRHNAIAIAGGRVYLVDRPLETQDLPEEEQSEVEGEQPEESPSPSRLLCLDAATGDILWEKNEEIYGTTLLVSEKHDVLLMGYQFSQRRFQLPSEKDDRLTGLRASDGERLWEAHDDYISRPIINDRTVYTQPIARDLLTGRRDERFRLSGRRPGGCGIISGSSHLLLYRSGTLGYTDLTGDYGTENYGGVRPGCWINAIAAGGLVLMPDATDRCVCSYLIKASIALQPRGVRPMSASSLP